MNYLKSIIFCSLVLFAYSARAEIIPTNLKSNKILISKVALPIKNLPDTLNEKDIDYAEYDENYWIVKNVSFLYLSNTLTKNISKDSKVFSYRWRCVKKLVHQQKIADSLLKNKLHHILFESDIDTSLEAVSPYCYMFLAKDGDKVHLLGKEIMKPIVLGELVIMDGTRVDYINHDFSPEELNLCRIALITKFIETDSDNRRLIVSEIMKDTTNTIKIGDIVSPYSYRGIGNNSNAGAIFCRRYNQDFLNFIDKEESVTINSGLMSVNEIRNFFKNNLEKFDHKGNIIPYDSHGFNAKEPFHINRDFFIEELALCEILLLSDFSEKSGKFILSVSKVIHDKTSSLSVGDYLTAIPFREMLDPNYTGALLCRRYHTDFLNFFGEDSLIEPDKTPISTITNTIQTD